MNDQKPAVALVTAITGKAFLGDDSFVEVDFDRETFKVLKNVSKPEELTCLVNDLRETIKVMEEEGYFIPENEASKLTGKAQKFLLRKPQLDRVVTFVFSDQSKVFVLSDNYSSSDGKKIELEYSMSFRHLKDLLEILQSVAEDYCS